MGVFVTACFAIRKFCVSIFCEFKQLLYMECLSTHLSCYADEHQEQEELLEEGLVCLLAGCHVLCGVVFFLERGRKLIVAQVVDIGC